MRLFLALLLLSFEAGAATWYVRPNTGEYGAEDGSSYAAAFDGPEDITWGAGGVEAGDTLIFCGSFNAGSGATYWIEVGASGSDGSPITITGDCSSQGDLSRAVLDGDGVRVAAITTNDEIYINFESLQIQDFTTRGLFLTTTTAADQTVARYINIDDVVIDDINGNVGASPTGIFVTGRNVSVTNSSITNIGDDAISVRGKNFTAIGNTIALVGVDTTNGDCIALGGASSEMDGYRIEQNTCDHTSEDEKQCFVMSLSVDNPTGVFIGNTCEMPVGASTMNGLLVDAGNFRIERNWFSGGASAIVVGNGAGYSGHVYGNIIVSPTLDGIRNDFAYANQTVTQANNVIVGAGRYGINANCNHATCSTPTYNNVITGSGTACLRTLNTTFVHQYNAIHDCAEDYLVNTTPATPDATTVTSNPALLGGVSPTTAEGFKPNCAVSPLKDAGTYVGQIQDYTGRFFVQPVDIGAFACQGGTHRPGATSRAAKSARAASTARSATGARP